MRTTRTQPPDMKGRKTYSFRCGCCWARNRVQEELERITWREAEAELVEPSNMTDEVDALLSWRYNIAVDALGSFPLASQLELPRAVDH